MGSSIAKVLGVGGDTRPMSPKTKAVLITCLFLAIVGGVALAYSAANGGKPLFRAQFLGPLSGGGALLLLTAIGAFIVLKKNKIRSKEKVYEPQAYTQETRAKGAVDYATKELKKRPDIKPENWALRSPPKNNDITKLLQIVNQKKQELTSAYQKYPDDLYAWKQQAVQETMDAYLKVCFAISLLTLDDLPGFTNQFLGKPRSYSDALGDVQTSYAYRTIRTGFVAYHNLLRAGCIMKEGEVCALSEWKGHNRPNEFATQLASTLTGEKIENSVSKEQLEKEKKEVETCQQAYQEYSQLFYKEGTKQYEWRMLYHEFLDRVELYVSSLGSADFRFSSWTQRDEQGKYEKPTGTLPT